VAKVSPGQSPYEVVLGEQLDELHPKLRPYFAAIPAGQVGRGSGIFSAVGTPKRWIWPILWVLARQSILFPVWSHDVPFTVENRPSRDADDRIALIGLRGYQFADGERTMVDAITAEPRGLVDYLGTKRRFVSVFEATTVNGMLQLTSTRTLIRFGRWQLPIARWFAPVVTLTERYDDSSNSQRVSVILTAPLVGRIYEYEGTFSYGIETK
jgi:Domain of unknown function (DUF4166)